MQRSSGHTSASFNPRPRLSPGATTAVALTLPANSVSIRAPGFHRGRPVSSGSSATKNFVFQSAPPAFTGGDPMECPGGYHTELVSIRAPGFHRGRPPLAGTANVSERFQSAPPAFTGGDLQATELIRAALRVSIRAPGFHRGRPRLTPTRSVLAVVSIRAPGFHRGRPRRGRFTILSHYSFNPRPRLSPGATFAW